MSPGPVFKSARSLRALGASALLALAPLTLARAADLSGTYVGHGARLDVVDSPSRVLVIYRAEQAAGDDPADVCECTLEGQRSSGGAARLDGAMDRASLRTAGARLVVLEAEGSVCCGLRWPGRDAFELSTRAVLPRCRARRTGAAWYRLQSSSEGDFYEPAGGRCAPGDEVVAVPDAPDERYVPARRSADGRAGFLLRNELDCLLPRSGTVRLERHEHGHAEARKALPSGPEAHRGEMVKSEALGTQGAAPGGETREQAPAAVAHGTESATGPEPKAGPDAPAGASAPSSGQADDTSLH